MKFFPVLFLGIAIAAAEEKPKSAERHVRFLAVGELPPFRQEIRDDVRYELEPPEGSIPPREVRVGYGGEKTQSATLRLGQISPPLVAPAGGGPLLLRRLGEKDDSPPWLRLTRPESDDFLVILWRASPKGTWKEAGSLIMSDGPLSAPAGSVRVVNVAPVDVGIVIGSEKLVLSAGKTYQRQVPAGPDQMFQIVVTDAAGSPRRLHSGTITQNPGERSLVLVYRADGEASRRPVKVSVLREPAPARPLVPGRKE
ncbi:MAG: hypothetical protein RLZZ214_2514 [Verrucomicrobiota bacterium]|jgi:hypothetical protein